MALVHDSSTYRTSFFLFASYVLKFGSFAINFHLLLYDIDSRTYSCASLIFEQVWNCNTIIYLDRKRLLWINGKLVVNERVDIGFKLSDMVRFCTSARRRQNSFVTPRPFKLTYCETFPGNTSCQIADQFTNSRAGYIRQTVVSFMRYNEVKPIQQPDVKGEKEKTNDKSSENDVITTPNSSQISMLRELVATSRYLSCWDTNDILCYMMKQPNTLMENHLYRLASFASWPKHAPAIYSSYLVDAGFYFDLNTQSILCFLCGLCVNISDLKSHSNRETIVKLHVQYSGKCIYALDKLKELEGCVTKETKEPVTTTDYSTPVNSVQNTSAKPRQTSLTFGFSDMSNPTTRPESFQTTFETNCNAQSFPVQTFAGGIAQTPRRLGSNFSQTSSEGFQPRDQSTIDSFAPNPLSSFINIMPSSAVSHEQFSSFGRRSERVSSKVFQHIDRQYSYPVKHPQYRDLDSRFSSFQALNTPDVLQDKCTEIAQAGFFYTGERDTVRCFCCDIGLAEWMEEDIAWEEHAKHSSGCPFLNEEKSEEFIRSVQEEWVKIYCPKHPCYSDLITRLRSFDQFPEHSTQSREDIAEAGFFYTGEEDIVRCHYCDGGLKEFEPDDVPWVEHAKWFPFCKYLLKIKGRDFIQSVAAAASDGAESMREDDEHNALAKPLEAVPASTSCEDSISSLLQHMGYTQSVIREAVAEYSRRTGSKTFTADNIMNVILDNEESISDNTDPDWQREQRDVVQDQLFPPSLESVPVNAQGSLLESGYLSCPQFQTEYYEDSRYNQGQETQNNGNIPTQYSRNLTTQNSRELNTLTPNAQTQSSNRETNRDSLHYGVPNTDYKHS